ncbi:hypothetical protein HYX19_04895 [Candidatus Woesearchaeota archaeon]|nr:hypothetical protein [Candidatus Woesearchaeota archaeon]
MKNLLYVNKERSVPFLERILEDLPEAAIGRKENQVLKIETLGGNINIPQYVSISPEDRKGEIYLVPTSEMKIQFVGRLFVAFRYRGIDFYLHYTA